MIPMMTQSKLPQITWDIREQADGKFALIGKMPNGYSQIMGRFHQRATAEIAKQKALDILRKDKHLANQIRKDCKRKPIIVNMDNKNVQAFALSLSPERCAHMIEYITLLNVIGQMFVYCVDEMDGAFDELMDKKVKTYLKDSLRSTDKLLKAFYASRLYDDGGEMFNKLTNLSYDLLEMCNVIVNFGLDPDGKENFRMVEVKKVLNNVLPDESAERLRYERGESIQQRIFNTREEVNKK